MIGGPQEPSLFPLLGLIFVCINCYQLSFSNPSFWSIPSQTIFNSPCTNSLKIPRRYRWAKKNQISIILQSKALSEPIQHVLKLTDDMMSGTSTMLMHRGPQYELWHVLHQPTKGESYCMYEKSVSYCIDFMLDESHQA